MKMDLALNNPQSFICHKTHQTNFTSLTEMYALGEREREKERERERELKIAKFLCTRYESLVKHVLFFFNFFLLSP